MIFGNLADVQSDPLPLQVAKNVLSLFFHGLTPTRPPSRFLFLFQPGVDVIGKETRPTLIFGKMPDLMDLDEGVALFYRFDQLGGAPSMRRHTGLAL